MLEQLGEPDLFATISPWERFLDRIGSAQHIKASSVAAGTCLAGKHWPSPTRCEGFLAACAATRRGEFTRLATSMTARFLGSSHTLACPEHPCRARQPRARGRQRRNGSFACRMAVSGLSGRKRTCAHASCCFCGSFAAPRMCSGGTDARRCCATLLAMPPNIIW